MTTGHLGDAIYSPCKAYRYRLERPAPIESLEGPTLGFIMVNPSTATETDDDQTIRMVRLFGRRHGYGRIVIGNLFAYRSKDIGDLVGLADPIGPENDGHLRQIIIESERCYAAWGAENKVPKPFRTRWRAIAAMADEIGRPLYCLDHLAGGHPRHPQILKYESPDLLWKRPA